MSKSLPQQSGRTVPVEEYERHVHQARVQAWLPLALDAVQNATSEASLYDPELEARLNDVVVRLERIVL